MNFRVYTFGGELLGQIDSADSFTWTRKYRDPGAFTAQLPLTDRNIALTEVGNIVWFRGAKEYCVIETRVVTEGPDAKKIELSGRSPLFLLDRRSLKNIVKRTSGRLVARVLLDMFTSYITPIDGVTYEQNTAVTATFTDDVAFEGSLLDAAQECAIAADCGLQAVSAFADNGTPDVTVRLFFGKDRSTAQSVNKRVIFSPRIGNVGRVERTESRAKSVNTIYSTGRWADYVEDPDSDYVWLRSNKLYTETVYENDTEPASADRREMHITIDDMTSYEITLAEFKAKLRQEARLQLSKSIQIDSIEAELIGDYQYVYQQDYDVGDIVTLEIPELGLEIDKRVIEVQQVFEEEAVRVVPTLGEPMPSRIRFRRRR